MGASSWVRGYIPTQKKFAVSTLVGGKNNPAMPGYALRHKLWWARDRIEMPIDFYLSGELKWDDVNYEGEKALDGSMVPLSKAPLFDSQFHIAIENMSTPNMFTEKLIDCFQTKTIPIYYGAPNIDDTFNRYGMIMANSLDRIIDVCNEITPDTYERMLSCLMDNYEISHKYCDYDKQLKEAIIKLIN